MRREVRSIFTLWYYTCAGPDAHAEMPAWNIAPYIAFHWLLFRWFFEREVFAVKV